MHIKGWILALTIPAVVALSACEKAGDTVAKIGNESVTQEEFDAYLKFKRLNANDEKRREALLEQYLERAALAEAVDAALEDSDAVDRSLLEAELAEFRKEMLISRYFEHYLADKVSDDAVRNYYNANAKEFEAIQARVAHILFRTRRGMSEEERQVKLTAAHEAYSRLQKGEEFATVAENYSEDKISGKKGGDLGWLKEGAIDGKFSETVFAMKPGDISEPFETPFGFHVVKLLEGPVVAKRPFDAVKGDIRYRLRNGAKEAELKRLLSTVEIEK